MSQVLRIDSDEIKKTVSIHGEVEKLIRNRRSSRILKDYTDYSVGENRIDISYENSSLSRTLDRIKLVAKYARCELLFSETTNKSIQDYVLKEKQFIDFSNKALNIRNNICDLNDLSSFKNVLEFKMPNRQLYSLQLLSAYHLSFAQNACNFSVPGAGKTSIVYGAYTYLKNLPDSDNKKVDKLLIIGPLNSFGPWESEYRECFGAEPITKRLAGGITLEEKKQYFYESDLAEITLLSYASTPKLVDELLYFTKNNRVMIVLDEAHKIKNTDGGVIAKSILSLAPLSKSRVVLTGTPAPNGYEDLYNLFSFLWPDRRIIPFQVGQLKDMTKSEDDSRVDTLLERISPFFLRIKKSDLGIPVAINHPPIVIEMKPNQKKIYSFIENKYMMDLANRQDRSIHSHLVKARMIRLMQAATNPVLLKKPLINYLESEDYNLNDLEDSEFMNEIINYSKKEVPAKYEAVEKIVKRIISDGEKVIIWASFIDNILLLQDYLGSKGILAEVLYGATPVEGNIDSEEEEKVFTRERIIKLFHQEDCPYSVIIANPFAVSESISLHKTCHNAIYLERTFNAAHFVQSKDRIHRYGLKKGVETNYYFILSQNTIDFPIHERLEKKEKRLIEITEGMPIPLFSNVLNDSGDEDVKAVLRDYARRTK